MPADHGPDRKCVSKVLDGGTTRPSPPETGRVYQLQERVVDVLIEQSRADAGNKEALGPAAFHEPIAAPAVACKRSNSRRMERYLPGLAEFRLSDHQDSARAVDVAIVERDRFTDTQAGNGDQSQQGLVRRCPERRAQGIGGSQQRGDVTGRVHVRRGPNLSVWQVAQRWDLVERIERMKVFRETADLDEPLAPPIGGCPSR